MNGFKSDQLDFLKDFKNSEKQTFYSNMKFKDDLCRKIKLARNSIQTASISTSSNVREIFIRITFCGIGPTFD